MYKRQVFGYGFVPYWEQAKAKLVCGDPAGIEQDVYKRQFLGRPGMVMMLPQMTTTKPAPAARRTSRTSMVKPVGHR